MNISTCRKCFSNYSSKVSIYFCSECDESGCKDCISKHSPQSECTTCAKAICYINQIRCDACKDIFCSSCIYKSKEVFCTSCIRKRDYCNKCYRYECCCKDLMLTLSSSQQYKKCGLFREGLCPDTNMCKFEHSAMTLFTCTKCHDKICSDHKVISKQCVECMGNQCEEHIFSSMCIDCVSGKTNISQLCNKYVVSDLLPIIESYR